MREAVRGKRRKGSDAFATLKIKNTDKKAVPLQPLTINHKPTWLKSGNTTY